MSKEQEGPAHLVTAIHLNVIERSVTFDVEGKPAAKLTLASYGLTLETLLPPLESETVPLEEAQHTVSLTGRLTTKPREGKADRSGHSTAYARFAAHEPDRQGPHDYIASFHRHTVRIALGLPRDAQITVEGYPHPSQDEKRLDTFSVINLVSYPGKPEKRNS